MVMESQVSQKKEEDLLGALEDRWTFMAEAIAELKRDNAELKTTLEEREGDTRARDEKLTGADAALGGPSGGIGRAAAGQGGGLDPPPWIAGSV